MPHELPPLPYDKAALEPYIDTMTMEIHHGRHHKAYVDNLNKALADNAALEAKSLEQIIRDLAAVPDAIRGPVRNNGGGHWNHSFFWKLMAPNAGGAPTNKVADAINATFGSFADFQAKFEAAGLGRFGADEAVVSEIVDSLTCSILYRLLVYRPHQREAAKNERRVALWAHMGGFLTGFSIALLAAWMGWIKPTRDEETLLQVMGWERGRAK